MKKFIIVLICGLSFWTCKEASVSLKKSPVSGYTYEVFNDNSGDPASIGDQVFFEMDIYDDRDSLLQSYRNQRINPSVKIVDQSNEMRKKNPVLDIASFLSVGDSVAIIVPVDSVPNMPPGYEDVDHIEYHISIAEILSEDEFTVRIEQEQKNELAEMERLRELLPEVASLTAKTMSDYKAGKLSLEETENGVKYIIHERGGGDLPTKDRMVTMQYYGLTVADGNMFDNSYKRGRGYSFRLGRGEVIKGWDEVTPNLPVGTTASVFIPAELGYGALGSPPTIPANAELYFYMTVEELYY